ncbi:molybdenum cofactor biosynthesis protein MoaE [Microbacterium protaetiae]|uniref:molybdenum cofactor biosynthesis protein MoaE n=1 Tax=Microbacterium protaetiae TaxID=2509458 RepID=UPI0030F3D8A3
MTVRLAQISSAPLDVAAHIAAVDDPRMGAEITFVGRVRDHDPDAASGVVALEYSSHPDAEKTLAELAAAAVGGASRVGGGQPPDRPARGRRHRSGGRRGRRASR